MGPLMAAALIQGGASLLQGLAQGKQASRQAQSQAEQARLARELAQRTGISEAQASRLAYLMGAQQQEQSLAGQRLAAMDLGKLQDFEQLQARREGLSDVARNWQPPRGMSPAASAFAAQTPNVLAPFASERFRESAGRGRTQASIDDYTSRVNELRRNPQLDAESRAVLDQVLSAAQSPLPQVGQEAKSGLMDTLMPILLAGAAGAGTYYGLKGAGAGGAATNALQQGQQYKQGLGALGQSLLKNQPSYSSLIQQQIAGLPSQGPQSSMQFDYGATMPTSIYPDVQRAVLGHWNPNRTTTQSQAMQRRQGLF